MNYNRLNIAMAALSLMAMTACSSSDENTADTKEEVLPLVAVDVAHQQTVAQTKTYTANVEADNINNISPNSPNRITDIRVDVGDRVHKGQVLVTFDNTNIKQAGINLETARREYDRAKQLLDIGAGTQQAVDQISDQLANAQATYDLLSRNATLTSPINGVVTARNYDAGDMTGNLPVLTVGQLSPNVKVIINVSENDRALVRQGQPVEVTFDAFPDDVFTGRVSRIHPSVDPATRTFAVELLIPNKGEKLVQGMFARVNLDLGEKDQVVVPDLAVVKQPGSGNRYVYVYSNGHVSYNRVELGRRLGNAYELLSGVNDGDTVVIAGQSRLADGVAVELEKK